MRAVPLFTYIDLTGGQKKRKEITTNLSLLSGLNCEKNIDECASGPCLNQGICTDGINSYTCHCSLPFTGWSRQTCGCPNGFLCVRRPLSLQHPLPPFVMLILLACRQKTGKHCEVEQVPCASHPCEKGGVCRPSADYTSYTCRCPAGWQGTSVLRFVVRLNMQQSPKNRAEV